MKTYRDLLGVAGFAPESSDWLAIAISLAAFLVAAMSYLKATAAIRAEIFLDFRKRFSELKVSIPDWYNAAGIPKDVPKGELRAVELYWQNAFDEWFVTNKLEPWNFRKLWHRFYKGILIRALSNGALREAAARLTHGSAEFGEHQDEFRTVLNALCMQAYNEPLCGDKSCAKCNAAFGRWGRLTRRWSWGRP